MNTTIFFAIGCLWFSVPSLTSQIKTPEQIISLHEPLSNDQCAIRYYYYPNLQAYYDLQTQLYLVQQKGVWLTTSFLEIQSRGYSLRNCFYVPLYDCLQEQPYLKIAEHQKMYPADYSGKRKRKQLVSLE